MTSIGNGAFSGCSGLTSVLIPISVTSIGGYAFLGCSGLTSVTCLAESVPTTDYYAFDNSPISSATLHVPVGSKAAYEVAYPWKDFKEIVEYSDLSLYDNVVYIEDIESTAGHPVTLSLKMNNTIAPTGFQCDVYLPEGVTAAQDGDGFYLMDISTERTTAKKTDYSNSALQPDGGLRFMCSSTKSYTFSGSEGEVAYLTVNIDPDLEVGSYPLILKNIEISDANSNAYRVSYVVTTLKILEYTLGDANNDGNIGVSDFTAIANCIMGTPPANFVEKAADVNADGVISVSDLTGEANIILYGSVAPNVSYAKAPYGYDNRYACIGAKDVRALAGEEFTVAVNINGNYEYSGYQFDMNIPEGMSVQNVSREKKGSDLFMSRMTDGNTLRVLSASPTGEVSENTVVYVTLAAKQEGLYSLDINNAIVSADAVTYSMDKSSFMVGIDKGTTGIATVDGMTDGNNGVAYDLTGKKVEYDGNAASLKKGIYIINGKKVSK